MHKKAQAEVGVMNGWHSPRANAIESTFLTKAQQETLDAAVLEKQKKAHLQREKSHSEDTTVTRTTSSNSPTHLKDRLSRQRSDKLQGKPKKHGAGGKYNWGSTLDSEYVSGAQDPNDPNYDSESETAGAVFFQGSEISLNGNAKPQVVSILKEYLVTGNQEEAIGSLQIEQRLHNEEHQVKALHQTVEGAYIVRKIVSLSLDHNQKERELTSQLLSSMYGTIIQSTDTEQGFEHLLEAISDLQLDVPDAVELLSQFMARAVVDDILPPSFLTKTFQDVEPTGDLAVEKAQCLLKAPHSAQRLQTCWGRTESSSYASLVQRIQSLLDEYVVSNDANEAQACVRAIGAPLAMHELVKQAVVKAMSDDCKAQIFALLDQLNKNGVISHGQYGKGLSRLSKYLDDLSLDIPGAQEQFSEIAVHAKSSGWITDDCLDQTEKSTNSGSKEESDAKSWASGLQAFKKSMHTTFLEYFSSGDMKEVQRQILEMNQPGLHSLAIKQLIQLGLTLKDREREMAAKLLVTLHNNPISDDQVALGCKRLLASVEDLVLDVPTAPHDLSICLARLIVDEILPPAFLTTALESLRDDCMGVDVIKATGNLLRQRHAYERIQSYWHPNSDFRDVRSKIDGLVKEFMETGDEKEASRQWRDLSLPFYGHQLVFTILRASFGEPAKHEQLLQLLSRMTASGEISETQLDMGFDRTEQQMSDLELDFPKAPMQLEKFKLDAQRRGLLGSTSLKKPNSGVHPGAVNIEFDHTETSKPGGLNGANPPNGAKETQSK